MPLRLTATRIDPACGTCRRKCRKCDRTRPVCNRCVSKGLVCEGYPPKYQYVPVKPGGDASETLGASAEPTVGHDKRWTSQQRAVELTVRTSSCLGGATVQFESPDAPPLVNTPPEAILEKDLEEKLHAHIDEALVDQLAIVTDATPNPFRVYILPLSTQHSGVLHSLLGLSAYHMVAGGLDPSRRYKTAALQYKLSAIRSLSSLLTKEEVISLNSSEEEVALAIVLLLVLQDVCESGISTHGAHLTGVTFLCRRIALRSPESRSATQSFLISALSWLDVLRGFSGGEKLAHPPEVRQCILESGDFTLESFIGCPVELFHQIGIVLYAGKEHRADILALGDFQLILDDCERYIRNWQLNDDAYATKDEAWKYLAEAYRHACILRILRFPNTYAVPCEDDRIQASVTGILDACAKVPMESPVFKRLLFPLFLAGADSFSLHQKHYVQLCIHEIRKCTGFQHQAMLELLEKVWQARIANEPGWKGPNRPWMKWTCSAHLKIQHAYLFF